MLNSLFFSRARIPMLWNVVDKWRTAEKKFLNMLTQQLLDVQLDNEPKDIEKPDVKRASYCAVLPTQSAAKFRYTAAGYLR
jgi:hypothetical protein